TAYNYRVAAKLKPNVTVEQARADLAAIGARLAASFPENRQKTFTTAPMRDQLVGPVRTMLMVLMGAVALVLLIACANVANLLLARATTRVREMAVRTALGAGRASLIKQLLTESLVLGLLGGLAGCALAYLGTDAMLRLAPENLPRLDEVRVDTTTLLFATVISMLSAVLFSLLPAWQASRVDVNEALKQSGGRSAGGRGSHKLRGSLAAIEIALAFVLALGAGLLLKSFLGLTSADLGFRTDGILVMYAHVPANEEAEYKRATGTFEKILRDVSTLPGVTSASAAMGMPAGQYGSNGSYAVEGRHSFTPGAKLPQAGFRLASPGYFSTLGIPLLRGRDFSERDQYSAPVVAIISRALARETFPNEDPIGRRIKCGLDRDEWMTVIG
ncbi:MAG TPA: FtsX-like permease family protein, partial [Holophaga sp.]|nr:FtsX-like permease family protein [Holophaga sp.]